MQISYEEFNQQYFSENFTAFLLKCTCTLWNVSSTEENDESDQEGRAAVYIPDNQVLEEPPTLRSTEKDDRRRPGAGPVDKPIQDNKTATQK